MTARRKPEALSPALNLVQDRIGNRAYQPPTATETLTAFLATDLRPAVHSRKSVTFLGHNALKSGSKYRLTESTPWPTLCH